MRYLPHTSQEIDQMLDAVGVRRIEELFSTIPEDCRRTDPMALPESATEWEVTDAMTKFADTVAVSPEYRLFAGAGSYDHYIPSSVSYLLGRSEFVTSYTPYQPEMSQGTLQAIYEYQSLVSRLLGMEVGNASLYDGASALAEALLMAIRITGRNKVAVSDLIHPAFRQVVETYFRPTKYEVVPLSHLKNGTTDLSRLEKMNDLAAVAVQSPNFLGCIENLDHVSSTAHTMEALSVACFTEPIAYGLYRNPGNRGADIACGEGQSLGIPRSFGGPALGLFATKLKHVRNMPGRLVGETTDSEGRRGYVLTLATREQHIRREKATSNICTNNSLCAVAAAMFMASAGGTGMKALSRLNYDKCEYLKGELQKIGCTLAFDSPTFNEFVVKFPPNVKNTYHRLLERKIVAGIPLERFYPDFEDHYLLCVTETTSKESMDDLVQEIIS